MNSVTFLKQTETMGAREFRQKLDKMLRKPFPCRVMLHNKPALAVLPDEEFLTLLEILEELKDSGLWKSLQHRLQQESKKKHPWFWSRRWQRAEREVDREIKAGRVRTASSVEEFLKELKA